MRVNDYLVKIHADFAQAKAKAEAIIFAKDNRSVSTPSPVVNENIPFDIPGNNQLDYGVNVLTALNPVSADFDIHQTTKKTYQNLPLPVTTAVVCDGEVQTVYPAKQQNGEICGIDWVSVTMLDTTFDDKDSKLMTSQGQRHNAIVKNISKTLTDIFGFGISKQNNSGVHMFETSYQLEHNAGLVALGGQKNKVLIQISGTGCDYAKDGWQSDFYAFLKLQAVDPKITRLDLAFDDLEGRYPLSWFAREFDKGGFNNGGRRPRIEMYGDWKYPDGSGRTLYIGSSKSPRRCRIYEKGKELGDPNSPWVRTEVEFKAKGMRIDLDALIAPSNFFSLAYPCFKVFDQEYNYQQRKFERLKQAQLITFASGVGTLRHQFGRWINCFRQEFLKRGLTDTDLLDLLTDIKNKSYPDRLDPLSIKDYFNPSQAN